MPRVSNTVFGAFSVVTLLLGAAVLAGGIYLGSHPGATQCDRDLRTPALVLGGALLALSLAGLAGACCRATLLLWIYLFFMFFLIIAVIAFTIFSFVVTNAGAGHAVDGFGFKEYNLGDFSNWLQKQVDKQSTWSTIRSCLIEGKVCSNLGNNQTLAQFVNTNLSPIESGCCKPPVECGFTYQNQTYWIKTNTTSTDPDCTTWSNDQSDLCYSCDSCKAGVLANLKVNWQKITIVNVAFIVLLIIVYSIGCCALRNNRRHEYLPVTK